MNVQLGRELLELPWDSRQALLDRLSGIGAAARIVAAFQAVGTSRPVTFKPEDKPVLLGVLEAWLELADAAGLPAGIFELRNALRDDLADAREHP